MGDRQCRDGCARDREWPSHHSLPIRSPLALERFARAVPAAASTVSTCASAASTALSASATGRAAFLTSDSKFPHDFGCAETSFRTLLLCFPPPTANESNPVLAFGLGQVAQVGSDARACVSRLWMSTWPIGASAGRGRVGLGLGIRVGRSCLFHSCLILEHGVKSICLKRFGLNIACRVRSQEWLD